MNVLVVSCYELGHQPLAAASTLAFLERAGFGTRAVDLSVEPLEALDGEPADLVAISVPMHTALEVGVRAAARIRACAADAHICFFGLYAILNAEHLLEGAADSVIGGEFEQPLVELASALAAGKRPDRVRGASLERLAFPVPSRDRLPALSHYAGLEVGTETRPAAAVEASRGCLHLCRHCPIPPVYGGRFFVVPRDVVLEDIRRLASLGARHITFADPDFFNGPGHTMSIVRAMHAELPDLTFDVTTKVELLLRHADKLAELAACGCLFVVSAVESLSSTVLGHLMKGHTRDDVFTALRLLRDAEIALRPSLVSFTPWTELEDYCDVLDWIEDESLVHHIDPVQLSIRLLVPPGSNLLGLEAMRAHLRGLDAARFSHRWEHPDPRMDRLHAQTTQRIVRAAALAEEDAQVTFDRVRDTALRIAGQSPAGPRVPAALATSRPPRLTEPWFC